MSFFAFKILYCQKIGCFPAKKRLDAFFFEKMPPFYFEKKENHPFVWQNLQKSHLDFCYFHLLQSTTRIEKKICNIFLWWMIRFWCSPQKFWLNNVMYDEKKTNMIQSSCLFLNSNFHCWVEASWYTWRKYILNIKSWKKVLFASLNLGPTLLVPP